MERLKKLHVVEEKTAIHLKAKRDFIDRFHNLGEDIIVERRAGDEWLFRGPGTYLPQIEVDVVSSIKAVNLNANQALRLRARDKCLDYLKTERKNGEEWNVQNFVGAYLPDVYEEVVAILEGIILTHKKAIHVKALRTYHDRNNVQRKAGTQWLVKRDDCEVFIPDVTEEVVNSNVPLMVLTSRQFCFIVDPVDTETGKQNFGTKKLLKGPLTFFLQPGERSDLSQNVQLLGREEYIKLTANEGFEDGKIKRKPGDKWIIYGPNEVWMTDEIRQVERGRAFLVIEPLGIYLFSPALFMLSIVTILFVYFYGGSLIGL